MVASSAPAEDRTPAERWTMIWARDEQVATTVPTSDDERAACARLVMPDGGLHVYGIVLSWLGDRRRLLLTRDLNQDLRPAKLYYGSAVGRAALQRRARRRGTDMPHRGRC